jgi:TatD DNase family protein
MPLMGRQGKRNSPEFLPEVLDSLMALRKESKQEILQACLQNVSTGLVNL